MSPTEAAWLAGFFDGEGSLVSYRTGRGRSVSGKLAVSNTSRVALDAIVEITGVGAVAWKKKHASHVQQQWIYQLDAKRDIRSLLEQMLPYLIVKRQTALDYLDGYTEYGRAVA